MFDGFVSWARQAAIRLPDPIACTPELEAFVAQLVAGKRILFVGEADHWIHEKIDYRLAFAEAALPSGFDWFGEELGWSDGRRIDDHLNGRPGASLDRITLFGHRDELRADRDDSPTGILRASFENPPDELFRDEHLRLLAGLQRLTQGRGLRFFGFDVDGVPGGAYADLEHRFQELPSAVRAGFARVPGESLDEEVARLTRCLDALEHETSNRDPLLRTSLVTLRDSFCYVALAHPAESYDALNPAMAFRERVMHRTVDTLLPLMPRGHGLVLWGHDQHLARGDAGIHRKRGVGPGGDAEDSLGQHLARGQSDDIAVIWMVTGSGEDSQPFPDLSRKLQPPRRSLNGLLGRVGGSFVLPTRREHPAARRLGQKARLYGLYNDYVELRVAEQADAICFIDRVSPLRAATPAA